jgi:hypothetical protein
MKKINNEFLSKEVEKCIKNGEYRKYSEEYKTYYCVCPLELPCPYSCGKIKLEFDSKEAIICNYDPQKVLEKPNLK